MISKLHDAGISSDVMFGAGLASVGLSIVFWAQGKRRNDGGRRERTGLFVGLWAPTFMVIGSALTQQEK